MLEQTRKLAQENNDLLRSMRRSGRISMIMRLLYWVVIIISSVGAYYFIQPYIDSLTGLYSQAQKSINSVQNVTGSLQNFLK